MPDIVLKDRGGNPVIYPGVKSVNVLLADGSEAILSQGGAADYYISYMSIDGTEELYSKPIMHGDTAGDVIALGLMDEPQVESTLEKDYQFLGWSDSIGGEVKTSMFESVTENRTVYAVYKVVNVIAYGDCGESAHWKLNEEGTLTIYGEGAMADYSAASGQPWYNYAGTIKNVVIHDGITRIGNQSLRQLTALNSVTIADSVTVLGTSAFLGCTALESIDLPNSIDTISSYCFNESGLVSIRIPDKVTSLYYNFYKCTKLKTVYLNSNLRSIGDYTFYNCSSLTGVTIPEGVTSIGNHAFRACSSLGSISIPEGITSIGYYAFYQCTSLLSVKIPNSVTSIGYYAFHTCSALISATIGNSVETIGYRAFQGCAKLTSITIPSSVYEIGDNCFLSTGLTSAIFWDVYGWTYTSSGSVKTISSSSLGYTSTAATYLKSTYVGYKWTKTKT